MNVVDIAIVLLLLLSAILGFRSGLIQSVFSLLGLIAGIAVASWNYKRFAFQLAEMVHSMALAEAILRDIAGCVEGLDAEAGLGRIVHVSADAQRRIRGAKEAARQISWLHVPREVL